MANLNYNRPKLKQIDNWKKNNQIGIKGAMIIDKMDYIYEPNYMTFGKYKNCKFADIPSQYLEWLISITPNDQYAIRYARELSRREDYVKKLKK